MCIKYWILAFSALALKNISYDYKPVHLVKAQQVRTIGWTTILVSHRFNSLWPSDDAIMVSEIWVNFGSGNALLPDGTKPLHEPMLT